MVDGFVFLELAFQKVERLVRVLWFKDGIDPKSDLFDFNGIEIVSPGQSGILSDQFKEQSRKVLEKFVEEGIGFHGCRLIVLAEVLKH